MGVQGRAEIGGMDPLSLGKMSFYGPLPSVGTSSGPREPSRLFVCRRRQTMASAPSAPTAARIQPAAMMPTTARAMPRTSTTAASFVSDDLKFLKCWSNEPNHVKSMIVVVKRSEISVKRSENSLKPPSLHQPNPQTCGKRTPSWEDQTSAGSNYRV